MAGITALVGAGIGLIGSTVQAISANQRAQGAKGDVARARGRLAELEASRQDIINPYANMENLSGMASDTSGILKNRFANIGVATQAAEIQIEQANISLANTLDTLAATGASAGGATALAQAALQSKKGVSASIEQQEVSNQKNAAIAQGQIDQAKMGEQQRLQNINMSEAQRMQMAEAQGADYVFKATEIREGEGLDRAQTQIENAQGVVAGHQAARDGAIGSAIGQIGGVASAIGGAFPGGGSGAGGGGQFDVDTTTTFKPPKLDTSFKGGRASDKRLKKNIEKIGESPSGLNIYSFEYIDNINGDGVYQGVMSDEIPTKAVVVHKDGYDRVDYSKLDVEFKKISNEL